MLDAERRAGIFERVRPDRLARGQGFGDHLCCRSNSAGRGEMGAIIHCPAGVCPPAPGGGRHAIDLVGHGFNTMPQKISGGSAKGCAMKLDEGEFSCAPPSDCGAITCRATDGLPLSWWRSRIKPGPQRAPSFAGQDCTIKARDQTSNRVGEVLRKMFSLAVTWKISADNPATSLRKRPETARERFLSFDEIQRFADAHRANPDHCNRAVDRACLRAQPPKSLRDQTSLRVIAGNRLPANGPSAIHGA